MSIIEDDAEPILTMEHYRKKAEDLVMSTKVFQNGHQGFSATTLDGDATSLFFAVQRSDAIDKHARAMFAQRPRRTTVATSRPPLPPVSSSSSKTITLCDDVSPPSPTDVSILRSFSGQRRGLTKVAPTTNNGGVNVNVYILSDVSVSDNVMTNLRLSFKEDNGHRVTIKHLCDEWSGFDPFGVNNKLLHPFLEEVRAQCHAQIVDCVVVRKTDTVDALYVLFEKTCAVLLGDTPNPVQNSCGGTN
eukprot:g15523.t1